MKKLFFVSALFCAMCFASCGNKTVQGGDVDTITVDTLDSVHVDSAAVDSTVCLD